MKTDICYTYDMLHFLMQISQVFEGGGDGGVMYQKFNHWFDQYYVVDQTFSMIPRASCPVLKILQQTNSLQRV